MAQDAEHPGCPLEAVHKRLEDLHRQWHLAADAYFDPEGFRIAIQSAIQTARTVTFILQSNKRAFSNFDAWYAPWQEKFKADALMRWMVEARNKIEKQGDLEANSVVRAELVASYFSNEVPKIEVPAALFDAPTALVKGIPSTALGDHIRREGVVRIQRRWVENSLPDYELLDAVAVAYGRLSDMLSNAHVALGLQVPETKDTRTGEIYGDEFREGRLPCMIGHGEMRSIDVRLADGHPVELVEIERVIERRDAKEISKRYDFDPEQMFGDGSIESALSGLYATARKMFLKDGYHVNMVMMFRGEKPVDLRQLVFEDQGQKYLMMRRLANEVVRRGADAVIMIGEIWSATFDPDKPYRFARDAPERREALIATLIRKCGEPIQLVSTIERKGKQLDLGKVVEVRDGAQAMFAPIYEAWRREIPKEWAEAFQRKKS
ncbi:MAG TPA: hypothetical protein VHZ78_03905 [Rhizomicrobium sp.]|jgi:hypothetical protein|nr:hypothetical protein [Rhizomicrobium sp.]